MKSRFTLVEFPVFAGYIIHVEITSDFNKTGKKYKLTKGIKFRADSEGATIFDDNSNITFVFIKPNVSDGSIVHEAWHALRRMFKFVGVELEDEVVAYHLGYIVDKINRFRRGKK